MKGYALRLVVCFVVAAAMFLLQKAVFMLAYAHLYGEFGAGELWAVLWHGLPMDLCVAGYVSAIPGLLLSARACTGAKGIGLAEHIYFIAISMALGLVAVADTALYGHWDFKLDMTPVFYLMSSPSAVTGGLSAMQTLGAIAGWLAAAGAFYLAFRFTVLKIRLPEIKEKKRRLQCMGMMLGLTALLFIPIRGGFTVSTMNPSRCYFSQHQRLNHAAINPAFSLLYSATHPAESSRTFAFYSEEELAEMMPQISGAGQSLGRDTLLAMEKPDIYLIILESFSAHLLPSLGGEPVAMRLDSIGQEGLSFANAYACSFRTDRALPSILSAYAGIPQTSIMKYVDRLEKLPSWPKVLKDNGYDLAYYYGGDVNFTNMRAYLTSCGFEDIVCDQDFPLSQRLGKWGAHDDVLFSRAKADLAQESPAPRLAVIQTSSSHEPFEVPYRSGLENAAANAFAFTDSVVGNFVKTLKASPAWERSLVVLVGDHYGAYPVLGDSIAPRHRIPLILTGGALRKTGTAESAPISQADLAATLLGAMGISHGQFPLSHDAFDPSVPHFAYFAQPETAGMLADDGAFAKINVVTGQAEGPDSLVARLKAVLQTLNQPYDPTIR